MRHRDHQRRPPPANADHPRIGLGRLRKIRALRFSSLMTVRTVRRSGTACHFGLLVPEYERRGRRWRIREKLAARELAPAAGQETPAPALTPRLTTLTAMMIAIACHSEVIAGLAGESAQDPEPPARGKPPNPSDWNCLATSAAVRARPPARPLRVRAV
jgi:hypothetical protein